MLALLSSFLFLLYFSVVDYLRGECAAWKMYAALLVQFVIYSVTGTPVYLVVAAALVYGLAFQWAGLWFGADTGALTLVVMQYSLSPFLLLSMICFSLLGWTGLEQFRHPERNPRLVPAFFLALVLTSLIQFVSTFPTSI